MSSTPGGEGHRTHLRFRLLGLTVATALVLVPTACGGTGSNQASPTTTAPSPVVTSSDPTANTSATVAPEGTTDPREFLAPLAIDDRPHTAADYDRGSWHHWDDIDGDGCDARQQALAASSVVPVQLDGPCDVVTGDWVSAYDGFTTTNPDELDVDHIVPLANAHISGGWDWTPEQRRLYANTQDDLWVVSASSNRSKGASPPDQWRPPSRDVWCEYAQRWTGIKVRWGLSATTSERDALGQMLDTCPTGTVLSPTPAHSPSTPIPTTVTPPQPETGTYYPNCAAARAAGAAPLHKEDPGYSARLDRDGDGIACE